MFEKRYKSVNIIAEKEKALLISAHYYFMKRQNVINIISNSDFQIEVSRTKENFLALLREVFEIQGMKEFVKEPIIADNIFSQERKLQITENKYLISIGLVAIIFFIAFLIALLKPCPSDNYKSKIEGDSNSTQTGNGNNMNSNNISYSFESDDHSNTLTQIITTNGKKIDSTISYFQMEGDNIIFDVKDKAGKIIYEKGRVKPIIPPPPAPTSCGLGSATYSGNGSEFIRFIPSNSDIYKFYATVGIDDITGTAKLAGSKLIIVTKYGKTEATLLDNCQSITGGIEMADGEKVINFRLSSL
jgi:hypothetical protein